MDRRGWIVTFGIFAALAALVGGAYGWTVHEAGVEADARAIRREEREAERGQLIDRVRTESARLMPDVVRGVELGMPLEEVRRARRGQISPAAQQGPELRVFIERLANGGQVVYGFVPGEMLLEQIQVLSLLPSTSAIAPHLAAMNEQYGRPTGIWDCPTTGGVPTRRFTWRGSHVTVSDVFLLYGDRVSLTLYIATTDRIARSLRMSGCTPVSPDRIDEFPVASAAQMEAAAAEGIQR